MDSPFVLEFLDLPVVVEADPAVLECGEVIVVAVLVESHQDVGLVPRMEDLTGTQMDLENGRPA